MTFYDLKTFADKANAEAYFVNKIKPNAHSAGILFKTEGRITLSHDGAPPEDIGPDSDVWIVLRVSSGTKIEADQITIESQT